MGSTLLACLMESGRVDPEFPEEQWKLYESAATAGVPEAMLAAGRCLEHGIGVERDVDEAVRWYLKAAEWCRDKGYLAENPYSEGYLRAGLLTDNFRHLEKAAEFNHIEALLILAPRKLNQSDGDFNSESFHTGLDYYGRAAKKDCPEALLALGEIYEQGWADYFYGESWSAVFGDGWESVCLENAVGYYEQAKQLGCEYAGARIVRVQERLKKLEDQDNSESGSPT